MKGLVVFLIALFACLFMADLSLGQEMQLRLKDGHILVGEVVKCTDDTVTFKYYKKEGEEIGKFSARDLDPHSFYTIRTKTMPKDGASHLNLARYCVEQSMYTAAIAQYDRAKSLDPEMIAKFDREEKPQLLERHTSKLMANVKRALERGDRVSAEADLQIIITYFYKTPAVEEARAILRKIAEERLEEEAAKSEAPLEEGAMSVLLKDGSRINGVVVGTTEDTIKLQVPRGAMKVTTSLHAGKVDPYSFFDARYMTIGNDPEAHIKLIRFCIDRGMNTRAMYLYERLKVINPEFVKRFEEKELPALKEEVCMEMLISARRAMDDERLHDAARDLSFVMTRFDETRAAEQARTLLDRLEKKFLDMHEGEINATLSKLKTENKEAELKAFQEGMKVLAPALKVIEQGRKRNHAALKKSTSGQSIREFEAAAAQFKKAVNELDKLGKRYAEDRNLLAQITQYREEAAKEGVGAYVNAGRVYLDRTSFKQALACADKALAVDSESPYASSFRAEVEAAEQAMAEDAADFRFRRRGGGGGRR
jgi:tetratricopeptide (TPR) repeat protein